MTSVFETVVYFSAVS